MNGVLRIALYARVSSQKQADEQTIDSQRDAILQRIQMDGLYLTESLEFCDEGYSGSELLRPALETLRDRVAAGLVDRVYVHTPDRLARKYAHQALLLEEFAKHRCKVVFGDHQGLSETPETNLLVQMQGVIAEYEREKIMERTRRGRRYAASKGKVSVFGGAPYGYRYIKRSHGSEAKWEVDPLSSQHVQLMFNLVSRQGYSLAAVCRELARRGIKTPKGNGKWSPSTVRDILLNPAYSGQARYGKQRLVPRKAGKRTKRGDPLVPRRAKVTEDTDLQDQVVIAVPAIVDGLMFSQAKERMDENRKRQRQRQEGAAHLLSGLLICGECGSAYCGHLHRTRRNYFYYRCVGAEKHRYESEAICSNGSVKGYELEDYVWSNACELLRDPARLELELNRRQNESLSPESKCVELDQRIHGINDRMSRLIDAYESGLLTKPEFASRIEPLREEHDRELATLRSLRGQIADAHDPAAASELLRQFTESVGSKLSTASQPLKRQILQLLIRRIEIHRDEVRVVYKVPQNPFHQGPDNRGFLPHRLLCAATAARSIHASSTR